MENTIQEQIEQTESIELDLTAKGMYKWTIKVRDKELDGMTLVRLKSMSDELFKLYPNNVMAVTA
jgi:hypothetical protein